MLTRWNADEMTLTGSLMATTFALKVCGRWSQVTPDGMPLMGRHVHTDAGCSHDARTRLPPYHQSR